MKQPPKRHERRGSSAGRVALSCLMLSLFASCTAPSYSDDNDAGEAPCRGALCDAPSLPGSDAAAGDSGSPLSMTTPRPGAGSDARVPGAPKADASAGGLPEDGDAQVPGKGPEPDPKPPGAPESFALGSYVVHVRYFGVETSSGFSYAEDNVMLGRVARDPRGVLTLTVQNCANYSNAGTGTGLSTTARIVKLERYPPRVYALQVTGDLFQTTGPPTRAGYAEVKGSCPIGTSIPVTRPAQSWQGETCKCVSDDAPPSGVDDCRVIDSDEDGNPGFTVHWSGAVTRDLFAVRRDNSQLIEGKVSPDGHHSATFLPRHEHITLQAATGSTATATGLAIRPCVSSVNNPVRFAPLGERSPSGAEWTCAAMLQQTASLFVEPLKAPNDC